MEFYVVQPGQKPNRHRFKNIYISFFADDYIVKIFNGRLRTSERVTGS